MKFQLISILAISLFYCIPFDVKAQNEQYINMDMGRKWRKGANQNTNINVYWENPSSSNYQERQWVREAIEETWQKYANINFLGWNKSYGSRKSGIRILIDNYARPHTKGLGTELNGQYGGMVLNFKFRGKYKCHETRKGCIQKIAVHEFGHALGIHHEHLKPDCLCNDEQALKDYYEHYGKIGYYSVPCDIESVMNYCNPKWNNDGKLSKHDITGIRNIYGTRYVPKPKRKPPKPKAVNSTASIIDVLGDTQKWEFLYLNFDNKQFNFSIGEQRKKEVEKMTISKTGYYPYYIHSLCLDSKLKTYYGSGSGKVFLEKGKDYELHLVAIEYGDDKYTISINTKDK